MLPTKQHFAAAAAIQPPSSASGLPCSCFSQQTFFVSAKCLLQLPQTLSTKAPPHPTPFQEPAGRDQPSQPQEQLPPPLHTQRLLGSPQHPGGLYEKRLHFTGERMAWFGEQSLFGTPRQQVPNGSPGTRQHPLPHPDTGQSSSSFTQQQSSWRQRGRSRPSPCAHLSSRLRSRGTSVLAGKTRCSCLWDTRSSRGSKATEGSTCAPLETSSMHAQQTGQLE